jgi:hypothetical protein
LETPLSYFPNYLYEKYKEGSNKKVILWVRFIMPMN